MYRALLLCVLLLQCSKPFPELAPLSLLVLLPDHRIFVTATAYTGDLKTQGAGSTGVEGADRLCAAAKGAEQPGLAGLSSEYKALLVGADRVACATANCAGGSAEHINWVLVPGATYRRPDGVVVFTTNSAGIFDLTVGLQAPLTSSGTWWTGTDVDWQHILGNTCSDWAAGSPQVGFFGTGGVTDKTAITDDLFGIDCGSAKSLLCVR